MSSILRLSCVTALAFTVACADSGGGGIQPKDFATSSNKGDMTTSGDRDLATTDDLAVPPDAARPDAGEADASQPDLATPPDMSSGCTQVTTWPTTRALSYFRQGNNLDVAGGRVGASATGATTLLAAEYYNTAGAAFTLPKMDSFSTATSFASCTLCAFLYECADANDSSCVPTFFAQGGTMNVTTADNARDGRFTATLTNLKLVEWDFGNDVALANGRCYEVAAATIDVRHNEPGSVLWTRGDAVTDGKDVILQTDFDSAFNSLEYAVFRTLPSSVSAFDVSLDGVDAVFGTDPDVPGRYDLWTYDYTLQTSKLLATMTGVTGGAAGTLGKVTQAAISPDATQVAFIGEMTTVGLRDVYLVPLDGSVAATRVSPDRPAGTATNFQPSEIAWSPDGKYLAFAGDYEVNGKSSVYVVDTSAVAPTAVKVLAAASIGASAGGAQQLAWTSTAAGGWLLFRGELTANKYRLYRVHPDGNDFGVFPNTTNAADTRAAGPYGVSPVEDKLALAIEREGAAGTYDVYLVAADGAGTLGAAIAVSPVTAAASTNRGCGFSEPLRFSADGNYIACAADWGATDNKFEPWSFAKAGGALVRVAVIGAATDDGQDASSLSWAPSGKALGFIADHRVDNDSEAFRVLDGTAANQTPILVQAVVMNGDLRELRWTP